MLRSPCQKIIEKDLVFGNRKGYFEVYFLAFLAQKIETELDFRNEKCLDESTRGEPVVACRPTLTVSILSSEHFWFLRRLKRMECARPQPMNQGILILVGGWSDSPGGLISRNGPALGGFFTKYIKLLYKKRI